MSNNTIQQGEILRKINSPEDVKKLRHDQLPQLSKEVRQYIIDVVSHRPGHLGASLGTVELTVALHYVFNTPYDRVIWDVGHQAYAHKILTGRKDIFNTQRTYGGISGFPKMSESEYDAFGTGHSSTSISAALGMSVASQLKGEKDRQHIAVIGDGALTGGMAFEALNQAGAENGNLLVILNDNGIAIDKSVGALNRYFTNITASRSYNRFKNKIWNLLGGNSHSRKSSPVHFIQVFLGALKSFLFRGTSNLFESFNFRYFGPVDGHDIKELTKILNRLKHIQGPKVLHIVTKKGKGLDVAEKDPILYHAPGLFDSKTGQLAPVENASPYLRFQDVFGHTLLELATKNQSIVGITPAMPSGCSMNIMMDKMPERTFDVGIAEQHAVTFAAGLASQGLKPFCNIYSSFMQRAYDQVIHDVALQKLPVVLCLDRAGIVGEDGPTHHGVFDLAYFRPIPDLIISAPMHEHDLRNLMFTAEETDMPFVIRYPRGKGSIQDWKNKMKKLPVGKARCLKTGENIAILSFGHAGIEAAKACEQLDFTGKNAAHYNFIFLKPLDEEMLHEICKNFSRIITVEDGVIKGGFGSAVAEFILENKYNIHIQALGVPDHFVEQGSISQLTHDCGFDAEAIIRMINKE